MPASRIAAAFLALFFAVSTALLILPFSVHATGSDADKQCPAETAKQDYKRHDVIYPNTYKKPGLQPITVTSLYHKECVDSTSGKLSVKGKCEASNVCGGKKCLTPSGTFEDCKKTDVPVQGSGAAPTTSPPPPSLPAIPPPSSGTKSAGEAPPPAPSTDRSFLEQMMFDNPVVLSEQKNTISPSADSVENLLKQSDAQPGFIDKVRSEIGSFFSPPPPNAGEAFKLQPRDENGTLTAQDVGPQNTITNPNSTFGSQEPQVADKTSEESCGVGCWLKKTGNDLVTGKLFDSSAEAKNNPAPSVSCADDPSACPSAQKGVVSWYNCGTGGSSGPCLGTKNNTINPNDYTVASAYADNTVLNACTSEGKCVAVVSNDKGKFLGDPAYSGGNRVGDLTRPAFEKIADPQKGLDQGIIKNVTLTPVGVYPDYASAKAYVDSINNNQQIPLPQPRPADAPQSSPWGTDAAPIVAYTGQPNPSQLGYNWQPQAPDALTGNVASAVSPSVGTGGVTAEIPNVNTNLLTNPEVQGSLSAEAEKLRQQTVIAEGPQKPVDAPTVSIEKVSFKPETVSKQEEVILKQLAAQSIALQEMSATLSDDAVARGMAACESAPSGRTCTAYRSYDVAVQTEQAKYDEISKNYDALQAYKNGGELSPDLRQALTTMEKGQGQTSAALDTYAKPYLDAASKWWAPISENYQKSDWLGVATESWKAVPAAGNMVWGSLTESTKIAAERFAPDSFGFNPTPEEAARCGAVGQSTCTVEAVGHAANVIGAAWVAKDVTTGLFSLPGRLAEATFPRVGSELTQITEQAPRTIAEATAPSRSVGDIGLQAVERELGTARPVSPTDTAGSSLPKAGNIDSAGGSVAPTSGNIDQALAKFDKATNEVKSLGNAEPSAPPAPPASSPANNPFLQTTDRITGAVAREGEVSNPTAQGIKDAATEIDRIAAETRAAVETPIPGVKPAVEVPAKSGIPNIGDYVPTYADKIRTVFNDMRGTLSDWTDRFLGRTTAEAPPVKIVSEPAAPPVAEPAPPTPSIATEVAPVEPLSAARPVVAEAVPEPVAPTLSPAEQRIANLRAAQAEQDARLAARAEPQTVQPPPITEQAREALRIAQAEQDARAAALAQPKPASNIPDPGDWARSPNRNSSEPLKPFSADDWANLERRIAEAKNPPTETTVVEPKPAEPIQLPPEEIKVAVGENIRPGATAPEPPVIKNQPDLQIVRNEPVPAAGEPAPATVTELPGAQAKPIDTGAPTPTEQSQKFFANARQKVSDFFESLRTPKVEPPAVADARVPEPTPRVAETPTSRAEPVLVETLPPSRVITETPPPKVAEVTPGPVEPAARTTPEASAAPKVVEVNPVPPETPPAPKAADVPPARETTPPNSVSGEVPATFDTRPPFTAKVSGPEGDPFAGKSLIPDTVTSPKLVETTSPAPKVAEVPPPRVEPAPAEATAVPRPTEPPPAAPKVEPAPRSAPTLADATIEDLRGPAPKFDVKPAVEAQKPAGPTGPRATTPRALTEEEIATNAFGPRVRNAPAALTEEEIATNAFGPRIVPENPSLLARGANWALDNPKKAIVIGAGLALPIALPIAHFALKDGSGGPPAGGGGAASPTPPAAPVPDKPDKVVPPPAKVVPPPYQLPPVTRGPSDINGPAGGYNCVVNTSPVIVWTAAKAASNGVPCQNNQGGLGSFASGLGQMLGRLLSSQQTPTPLPTPIPSPVTKPIVPPAATSTPPKPFATLIASPTTISLGGKSRLIWSSINTSSCGLFAPGNVSLATSTSGSTSTLALATTTLFSLNCTAPSGATTSAQATVTVH